MESSSDDEDELRTGGSSVPLMAALGGGARIVGDVKIASAMTNAAETCSLPEPLCSK